MHKPKKLLLASSITAILGCPSASAVVFLDTEPNNNSFAGADVPTDSGVPPDFLQANANDPSDIDWFKFNLPAGQGFNFTFSEFFFGFASDIQLDFDVFDVDDLFNPLSSASLLKGAGPAMLSVTIPGDNMLALRMQTQSDFSFSEGYRVDLTPSVPEPATAALFAAGLAALGGLRRRQKRALTS